MELDTNAIERIKAKARMTDHGSVEVILDSTKDFVDIVLHDRERVKVAMPTKPTPAASIGKRY